MHKADASLQRRGYKATHLNKRKYDMILDGRKSWSPLKKRVIYSPLGYQPVYIVLTVR
jgi:hypothetical protein